MPAMTDIIDALEHCRSWLQHLKLAINSDESFSYYEVLCNLSHAAFTRLILSDELSDLFGGYHGYASAIVFYRECAKLAELA